MENRSREVTGNLDRFSVFQLYHLTISACDLLNDSDVSKFVGKVTSYKFNDNFFALLSNNLPKTCHAQFLTSATRYFAMLISIGFMSFLTQSILQISSFHLFLPTSVFLENIFPFEKICSKILFPQRISALSVYVPKCFVFAQNICPIRLSAQKLFSYRISALYWSICPISDYLPKIQKSAVLCCGCYSCCCRKLEKYKTPF